MMRINTLIFLLIFSFLAIFSSSSVYAQGDNFIVQKSGLKVAYSLQNLRTVKDNLGSSCDEYKITVYFTNTTSDNLAVASSLSVVSSTSCAIQCKSFFLNVRSDIS